MTVSEIVDDHLQVLGPPFTNFILNCPPNREGLLNTAIVDEFAQVGQAWTPTTVPLLPAQGPQNDHPYHPISATAPSGNAFYASDGVNDFGVHTLWQPSGSLPQSITLDLGTVQPDVGFVGYLPPYADAYPTYLVTVSTDGQNFAQVASGAWPVTGGLQNATFGPVTARYVRLTATAAMGGSAAATEITVGGTL